MLQEHPFHTNTTHIKIPRVTAGFDLRHVTRGLPVHWNRTSFTLFNGDNGNKAVEFIQFWTTPILNYMKSPEHTNHHIIHTLRKFKQSVLMYQSTFFLMFNKKITGTPHHSRVTSSPKLVFSIKPEAGVCISDHKQRPVGVQLVILQL